MVEFKKAKLEDANSYAEILNQSWKDTYGEYISYDYIDREFSKKKLIKEFKEILNSKNTNLYMIYYNNKIVGVTEFGSPLEEDLYKENMEEYGEWITCHIKKEFKDFGIGTKTFEFVYKCLKEMGFKKCFLWVKRDNKNGISFHEKNGFKKTNYTCDFPDDGAPSFVMERSL